MKEGLLRMALLLSSLSFNYLFERSEQRMITAKDKKTKNNNNKKTETAGMQCERGPES